MQAYRREVSIITRALPDYAVHGVPKSSLNERNKPAKIFTSVRDHLLEDGVHNEAKWTWQSKRLNTRGYRE